MKSHAGALSTIDIDVRKVTSVVLLLVIIAPFAVYAIPQAVGAEHSYVVLSGSMEPAIDVGDVVIVDRVAPTAIDRGDVITFTRGGESIPTTHRVLSVVEAESGLAFETKGDANEDADPGLVAANRVVGRVMLTIPLIGYIIEFVGTQIGFALLVVLPLGLLLLSEAWVIYHGRRVAAADAADAAASDASAESLSNSIESTEFQLTDRHLTIGIAISGLAAVGAGYAAYQLREGWLVGLATAAGGITLLLLASKLDWLGPTDDPTADDSPAPTTDGGVADDTVNAAIRFAALTDLDSRIVVTESVPDHEYIPVVSGYFAANGAPSVELADPATLFALAAGNGGRVIADDQNDLLAYVADGIVYTSPSLEVVTETATVDDADMENDDA